MRAEKRAKALLEKISKRLSSLKKREKSLGEMDRASGSFGTMPKCLLGIFYLEFQKVENEKMGQKQTKTRNKLTKKQTE